jgi:SOUL heme-binding protein
MALSLVRLAEARMWRIAFISFALLIGTVRSVFAVEEPKYSIVHRYADFEVRDYRAYLVAETTVESDFENAGNQGFRRLFNYISGQNSANQAIEMTAPVVQKGQKIAMTAPVIQAGPSTGFIVQFVMPSKWTASTLPKPNDKSVIIRQVPAARFAVIRYSGFWSASRYEYHLKALQSGMQRERLPASGSPLWARYDPPFMPWFLRRNEILIPISASP